ncbi:MAG: D-glycero-beta-D-manno-heptose,7-bisphosphate 7-phosphatase [Planctomycetota bacterium]|jgi:D-glycero-D-manno-heptose 1,7-bisphosphate phosphatase
MDPAIFLDRDGTLVPDDANAGVPARLTLLDGVAPSLRRLRDAGFRLVVATNQGGVAHGRFTEREVDAFHTRLSELLDEQTGVERTIERFYYCPFHPKGLIPEYTREHPWRKPRPGMLLQAAQDLELELERSWMIGDSPRDIAAGRSAGMRTILVSRDKSRIADAAADYSAASLAEAVELILRHRDETTASIAASRRATPRRKASARRARRERDGERMRRGIAELTEELRALRLTRVESSALRLSAMGLQLVALLVVGVAFLNLADLENFLRWSAAAAMLQLITITMLLFDRQ